MDGDDDLSGEFGVVGEDVKALDYGEPQLGLAVIERFHVLADHAELAAQVIIAVHLLGGILLLIGVLMRSASLVIGLIYLALATLDPQPATVLIGAPISTVAGCGSSVARAR